MMQDMVIEKLLADHQKYHSEFQIDNFIIGNAGDDWAQYKQALREIASRKNSLINAREQLELNGSKSTLLKKLRLLFMSKRAKQIYAAKQQRIKAELSIDVSEIERELNRFVELAKILKQKIGDLDRGKRNMLESDSWRHKAIRMAGIDLLVNGRVGSTTLEFILSLPKPDQARVIENFKPGAKVDPYRMIGL